MVLEHLYSVFGYANYPDVDANVIERHRLLWEERNRAEIEQERRIEEKQKRDREELERKMNAGR